MDDLISRQAAIDALKHNQDVYSHNFHDDPIDKYTTAIIATDIDSLVNLPSTQPEIIRCNSCKHWTQAIGKMRGFGLGRCDFHDAKYVTCNGFCYWAEREGEDETD